MTNTALLKLGLILAIVVGFVYWYTITPGHVQMQTDTGQRAGIANPASVNCINIGGRLEIAEDAAGGSVGYCHLQDGRVCEEWALMRDKTCVPPQN